MGSRKEGLNRKEPKKSHFQNASTPSVVCAWGPIPLCSLYSLGWDETRRIETNRAEEDAAMAGGAETRVRAALSLCLSRTGPFS